MPLHFLHIGKTGGCAIRAALSGHRSALALRFHPHPVGAGDIPPQDQFFFCIRDPATRFASAFNSRLRMGMPRAHNPWTEREVEAFGWFKTPNELAEALDSERGQTAICGINHLSRHQHAWFPAPARRFLRENRARIMWIGRTEHLASDFEELKQQLRLPDILLPDDPVIAHHTPDGYSTELSEAGRANVLRWYAKDVQLIEWLQTFRSRLQRSLTHTD